jgi:hypothetical protein
MKKRKQSNRYIYEKYKKISVYNMELPEDESYYDFKCYDVKFPIHSNYKESEVTTYKLEDLKS